MKLLQILIAGLLILSASLVFAGRESGEKGGTGDINIGVGELQETPAGPRGGLKDLKKPKGEKGGTEDMNIGVGELQETPADPRNGPKDLKKPSDEEEAGLLLPAVQNVREAPAKSKNKGGNAETTWKVEKGEK